MIGVFVLAIVHLFLYDAPFAVRAANALSQFALVTTGWLLQTKPFRNNRVGYGYVFLLYLSTYLCMFVLEYVFSIAFGTAVPLAVSAINHLANFVFGLGLLSIIDLQKTLFVNMPQYLLDIERKGSLE